MRVDEGSEGTTMTMKGYKLGDKARIPEECNQLIPLRTASLLVQTKRTFKGLELNFQIKRQEVSSKLPL